MPDDKVGQEAFAVIREAMRGKGMVALGRVVLAKRERVIMLQPWDKGLMGTTLRYAYEVRPAKDYFDDIADVKVSADMLKLAQHILDSKTDEFDPSTFVDNYEKAVIAMLQKKQAGITVPKESGAARMPKNVINLMDALRRSAGGSRNAGKTSAKPAKKSKKRVDGQREMLLPITGKKKEVGKEVTKSATRRRAS